jgi:glycosyltransferase involved in cell wall biosynthesis
MELDKYNAVHIFTKSNMKILFLIPYPIGKSPSQRFRFEQYFSLLISSGHSYQAQSFLSDRGWEIVYAKGKTFSKFMAVVNGFLRRLKSILIASRYDVVFIHREATPVGPPIFEWLVSKVLRKKIIYDFDDAIWLTDKTSEGRLEKFIRYRSKVSAICKWSFRVSCGNDFLCDYARQFNSNVVLNPTTIDTEYHKTGHATKHDKICIGWTGTHSTMKYLAEVSTALTTIARENPGIEFILISNDTTAPSFLKGAKMIKWTKDTEIEDLARIDIGIMPLPNDEWAMGKCGFKALQYMALEIPTIVSPVGVNVRIVTNEHNGLVCDTNAEWISALQRLIDDKSLRIKLGRAGRQKVIDNYSVTSNSRNFLELFLRSAIIVSASK